MNIGRRILILFSLAALAGCASTGGRSSAPVFTQPLAGGVYSGFSQSANRLGGQGRIHYGVDVPAPMHTPIRAAAAGRVVSANWQNGYGKIVIVDHGDGWQTRYAHLSEFVVSQGAPVVPGEQIGLVGATGNATGPHLHFEIRRFGEALDPEQFISWAR